MSPNHQESKRSSTSFHGVKRCWSMRLVSSFLLAICVIIVAIYYGSDLIDALHSVKLHWVGFGLLCYAVNYILRALRFRLLSSGKIKLWPEGLHAACLHGFATYMMPFRSGELTLPLVLRPLTGLSLTEGGRILIRARLLDLQTLGLWVMVAALIADISLSGSMRIVWMAMGAAMAIAPLLIKWLGTTGRQSKNLFFRWLGRFTTTTPFTFPEILISACIWTAVASCFFCAARSIGLPLSLMQVWLLIAIQLPMQLIPVQGIANAGNHEGGWVAGLMLLGVPVAAALEFALLSHAIVLLYVLALGPAALITGYFCSPEASS